MPSRRFNPSPAGPATGRVVRFDYNGRSGRGRIATHYHTGVRIESFDGKESAFAPHGHWWYEPPAPLPNRRLPPPPPPPVIP